MLMSVFGLLLGAKPVAESKGLLSKKSIIIGAHVK